MNTTSTVSVFDLVGLIDTETRSTRSSQKFTKTHPDVIFYGEGCNMDTTAVTKDGYKMTTQSNSTDVPGFAFFSDTLRDALKGHVFTPQRKVMSREPLIFAQIPSKGAFKVRQVTGGTTPAQALARLLPR